MQVDEVVEDLVQEAYKLLYKNKFKNLVSFEHRDDETTFRSWLAKIAARRASYLIQKYFARMNSDADVEKLIQHLGTISPEATWELFESIVDVCKTQSSRDNLDRDLVIYLLWVFEDFKEEWILEHPFVASFGTDVARNAKFRLRTVLRKHADSIT